MELEDFYTRIADIINYEWDQRQTTKFNKLLKKAHVNNNTLFINKSQVSQLDLL